MADFKKGDHVKWKTSQGQTEGAVVRKAKAGTKLKGHRVEASRDDPQYIVKSDKSGAEAAHKPGSLKKA